MSTESEFPPRMWIHPEHIDAANKRRHTASASPYIPIYEGSIEFFSTMEVTHLLSEAVRVAKAEAFEDAAKLAATKFMGFHTPYEDTENLEDSLKEKAAELRENGGEHVP